MASEHPFQLLFETLGKVPSAHAESVNHRAYEVLHDILTVPVEKAGRCILLRAPRAGHGKTHLLSRIQHRMGADHEFIPLQACFGSRIDALTVTDDALRRLARQLPASGGITILDLVARRLFAAALQPLVGSGEVPCQDREGALTALRSRPIETFDFHHPNAVTAHWARENFEVLGQRLSHELAQRAGLPVREVAFWVDALFRFASTPLENASRVRVLSEAVHSDDGLEMDRLVALLGLLTMLTRVVLVADDLEGFSTDETAALRLASFLGALRQSVERLDVILSLNKDIWESAFLPRLSGGLADRLSEVVVELEPLTEEEMAALLESRVPGLGSLVLENVDRSLAGTHARGLIQAAGLAWLKATANDSAKASVAPYILEEKPVVPPPVPVAEESASVAADEQPQASEPEAVPATSFQPEIADASAPVEQESPFTIASDSQQFAESQSSGAVAWPPAEFSAIENPADTKESGYQADEPVQSGQGSEAFQISAHAGHVAEQAQPEPVAAVPQQWGTPVEPAPAQAVVDSPFQIATQSAPQVAFGGESPFQIAPSSVGHSESRGNIGDPQVAEASSPSFQPSPAPEWQPAVQQPQPSAPENVTSPQGAGAEEDRVDDLLRQFRERYGRGGL